MTAALAVALLAFAAPVVQQLTADTHGRHPAARRQPAMQTWHVPSAVAR